MRIDSVVATIALRAHKKGKMSFMFFGPKIYVLIHIPANETRRPPSLFADSLQGDK